MLSILQCILYTSLVFVIWAVSKIHFGTYLHFELCKIVSQNTLRKNFNAFINGGLISLASFVRNRLTDEHLLNANKRFVQ